MLRSAIAMMIKLGSWSGLDSIENGIWRAVVIHTANDVISNRAFKAVVNPLLTDPAFADNFVELEPRRHYVFNRPRKATAFHLLIDPIPQDLDTTAELPWATKAWQIGDTMRMAQDDIAIFLPPKDFVMPSL